MKKKLIQLSVFLITLTFFSCSSDSSSSSSTPNLSSMTATIDGQAWASISGGAVASVSNIDNGNGNQTILQILGASQSFSSVSIQIPIDNLSVGTFNYTSNDSGVLAYSNSANLYSSDETSGNFTLTITSLDLTAGVMSGTFSGNLLDFDGNSLSITNGSFNSIVVVSSALYSNGFMSLKANNGNQFTMDSDNSDGKYLWISENTTGNQLALSGNNANVGSDFGLYGLIFPLNVASGTYNLTSEGFGADIGNSSNEPEFNVTSGSMTVTRNGKNLVGTFNYSATNGVRTVNVTNGSFDITHK